MTWRRSVLPWAHVSRDASPRTPTSTTATTSRASSPRSPLRTGLPRSSSTTATSSIRSRDGTLARARSLAAWLRSLERRLARHAVALVTVNRTLEAILRKNLGITRSVVVHNAPPRWIAARSRPGPPPGAPAPAARGTDRAVPRRLLGPDRGLEQLADAVLEPGMEAVHAVFLGFGSEQEKMERMAADPRFGGRVHVVDAVPPTELLPWVASADVAVMCIQPSTLNHRSSTPNKLFEALAAGVPVVASDFDEMRAIVLGNPEGPLGEVCRPTDVDDVARAIRRIVELPAFRPRGAPCALPASAHERWNWETESARLVALYEELAAGVPS